MSAMSPEARAFYKPRISNVEFLIVFLLCAPLWGAQIIFDVLVILSPLAAFLGLLATGLLTLFFYVKNVYKTKKNSGLKLGATISTFLVEIIPELDLIPGDLIDLVVLTVITRKEDRQEAEAKAAAAAKAARDQEARVYQYNVYAQQEAEQEEIEVANDRAAQIQLEEAEDEEDDYAEAA